MSHPIGIFDSGVGGLSILVEIRKALPEENLLYFADSGYCPYGTKPETEILDRVLKITDFLLKQGVKAIVIACNAASSASLDEIRKQYSQMPVIGIEPAVKPACLTTKAGKIGVLSTSLTLQGKRFSSLVEKYGKNVEIFTQPATGLADLVEAGELNTNATRELLNRYLKPLITKGIDTLLLGCTHYPFVKPAIQEICGAGITIIDNGVAVAGQLVRILEERGLRENNRNKGEVIFYTSGFSQAVSKVVGKLWPEPVNRVIKVEL